MTATPEAPDAGAAQRSAEGPDALNELCEVSFTAWNHLPGIQTGKGDEYSFTGGFMVAYMMAVEEAAKRISALEADLADLTAQSASFERDYRAAVERAEAAEARCCYEGDGCEWHGSGA